MENPAPGVDQQICRARPATDAAFHQIADVIERATQKDDFAAINLVRPAPTPIGRHEQRYRAARPVGNDHRHLVDVVTIRQRHHPLGMSTSITIVTRNAAPGLHDVAGQQILMLDFRPEQIEIVRKVVGKAGAEIDLATAEIGPAAPTAISIDRHCQFLKAPLEQRNRIVRQAALMQLHHKRTELIDAGPRSHHWSPEQFTFRNHGSDRGRGLRPASAPVADGIQESKVVNFPRLRNSAGVSPT